MPTMAVARATIAAAPVATAPIATRMVTTAARTAARVRVMDQGRAVPTPPGPRARPGAATRHHHCDARATVEDRGPRVFLSPRELFLRRVGTGNVARHRR